MQGTTHVAGTTNEPWNFKRFLCDSAYGVKKTCWLLSDTIALFQLDSDFSAIPFKHRQSCKANGCKNTSGMKAWYSNICLTNAPSIRSHKWSSAVFLYFFCVFVETAQNVLCERKLIWRKKKRLILELARFWVSKPLKNRTQPQHMVHISRTKKNSFWTFNLLDNEHNCGCYGALTLMRFT